MQDEKKEGGVPPFPALRKCVERLSGYGQRFSAFCSASSEHSTTCPVRHSRTKSVFVHSGFSVVFSDSAKF